VETKGLYRGLGVAFRRTGEHWPSVQSKPHPQLAVHVVGEFFPMPWADQRTPCSQQPFSCLEQSCSTHYCCSLVRNCFWRLSQSLGRAKNHVKGHTLSFVLLEVAAMSLVSGFDSTIKRDILGIFCEISSTL
jgi:hypothetical protein